jgi:hypothetical protein
MSNLPTSPSGSSTAGADNTRLAIHYNEPLFEGDIASWFSEKWGSGERLLLAAILQRAVLDAVLNAKADRRDAVRWRIGQQARHWIFSDNRVDFTSFLNVCEILELDPGWVRGQVLRADPKTMRKHARGADSDDGSEQKL